MRRLAVATLTVLIALVVTVPSVLATWPTTCVELNDLAEAAAGRTHNVGIYQRVTSSPAAAEAACQYDHRADVQGAFAWALGGSGAAVTGVWPTTCVALNDLAEASRGNPGNVGLYQRVYGNAAAAEAACRHDHRDDVRGTFWWAIQGVDRAPGPQPTPAPQPAVDASTHPDYARVRQVAIARGAQPPDAVTVAVDVIGRGSVDAFLRGEDGGVVYGRHRCDWQSAACPLAPVYVPPPPTAPRIDAALQPAWHLLASVVPAMVNEPRARTVRVHLALDPDPAVAAWYRPSTHTISVAHWLLNERPSVVASTLAHELWHAISTLPRDGGYATCIAEEVWGKVMGSLVWATLEGPLVAAMPAGTNAEWNLTYVAQLMLEDARAGAQLDMDGDAWDWVQVSRHVMGLYTEQCTWH